MGQNQVKRFPFLNKGIVQKLDINQLEDGQYAYLLNLISQQEDSLSPRYGYQDVTVNWSGAGISQPNLISSLAVTRDRGSASPTLYAASYRTLTRVELSGSGAAGWTGVPANIATDTTANDGNTKRIGQTQFKTDQLNDTGTVYFATGYNDASTPFRGMLRDDGSQALARYVGILPPAIPAIPTIAAPEVVNIDRATPYYFAPAGGGTTRVSTTVILATRAENVIGLGTGSTAGQDWILLVADTTAMQTGMYLLINGTLEGIIKSINATTSEISISLTGTPNSGDTVEGFEAALQTAFPSGGTYRLEGAGGNPLLADLSLSGTAATGYDSNDFIHISFYNGTPQTIKNVVVRLYPTYNGWYETTLTIADTAPDYDPSNPIPPYWLEFTIPKSDFIKNGVGSGDASWKNIFTIDYAVNCFIPATDTCEFKVGNIFGYGGGGPNSASSGAFTPYDYVYTYLDPESGAESNPSQTMNPANAVSVANQNVKIIVWGCDNTTYSTGTTKIAIYRRGGSFTDGAFRRIGLVTNPGLTAGDPTSAVFIDTLDDLSIINAKQAEFDNDAPVTSDLNQEYVGTIGAGQYYSTVTVSGLPGGTSLLNVLTPGTQVLIGGNKADGSFNQESCTVLKVLSSTTFKTYLQYAHASGEQITWATRAGVAGDIVMSAYDCLWMAGNPDNPHVLYRSKTGRPESWPIVNEATGNSHQLAISSPDNPIMGLAEFNGEIVCMCKNGIYTVRMDSGVMRGPIKTPANRGLLKKYSWGYVDNAIWFLSYDGIYSWNGSSVTKMSFAIDFVFNNLAVNGISPYAKDSSSSNADMCNIQQKGNEVFFNYFDSLGELNVFRYHLIFDRWNLEKVYDNASAIALHQSNITCLNSDRSSGDLFGTKATTTLSTTLAGFILYDQVGFYKDGGSVAPGTQPIIYEGLSKVYDMGSPFVRKNFTDLSVELKSGLSSINNSFNLDLYYDYSSSIGDTISVNPSGTTRQIIVNPLNVSSLASAGKEARELQWKISGASSAANTWNALSFGYIALGELIKGRVTDWDDLGHPYDKRLNEVTIEYDNGNFQVQLYLDIVSGINGGTQELAKQVLTLPAASGRSKVTLAINDAVVAKLVRLRPIVAVAEYQIFDYKFTQDNYPADRAFFTDYSDYGYEYEKRLYQLYINCDTAGQNVSVDIEGDGSVLQTVTVNGTGSNRMQPIPINPDLIAKLIRLKVSPTAFSGNPSAKFQLFDHRFDFEQLPKPIVLSTPWNDFGYDYVKFAEQIVLDVNTNGFNVPVGVYGDGVLKQTITVNGTQADRSVNITLNPGIVFQNMRLQVNPALIPSGGRFQLWDYKPIFRPYDKGAVYHTFDWDDLGHPYDKKISEVTIEFETNSTDSNIQIALDLLVGINGSTQLLNFLTLTLPNTSTGRGYKTFPLPEIVCKMIRIRSLGQNSGGTQSPDFKMWGYKFGNTIPYPADITLFTEWTDDGYACGKIFRGVGLQIDTGGVNCTVGLEADGVQVLSWTVNTTTVNRQVFLTPPSDTEIDGFMWRITLSPGSGGKAQLFGSPEWNLVKDACLFVELDTYNQAYGSAGYTVIKQIWVDYKCAGTITVRVYNQDGTLFYAKQLPAQTSRAVQWFFLPSFNGSVINKDKKHRVTITADDATKRFQPYRDSTRIMYVNLSADQRKGYNATILWQDIKIAI